MDNVTLTTTKTKGESTKSNSIRMTLNGLLQEGARAWNISQTSLLLLCAVPFIIAFTGFATALIGKDAYKWFTGEDRFAENLQVLFWGVAFVLNLLVVKYKYHEGDKIIASLYLILSVGIFFLIGEELSWGQRIFGWVTPDSMRIINKQEETNIHTIYGVDTMFKWMHLIIGAYGTFLPLLVMRSKSLKKYQAPLSMLVPHYTLIPFFFIPFIWRIYRNFFTAPAKYYFAIAEYAEVIELILSIAFVFFMVFQLRRIKMRKILQKQ
ncbi:MAG: hypothetical protein ACE5HS_11370 [bacterium]